MLFFHPLRQCDIIADSEGRTPLHWAVDRGHSKVVELLVSKDADVNAKVFYLCLLADVLILLQSF